ncbi:hypothetical protein TFA04_400002 [Tenacibaculum maritimum]|uniref:hypothetical protein n=1 Tax=Tenacibaculum maritimum TaxID=107401 RepID=UPI0010A5A066|nr:hypothetical protein [Tenacibaculum maritimum]QCD61810.1 hypothetical protein B9C57_04255 [Tenacibaculum maritimum]CAA0159557.1 hypothetical protein JIP1097_110005 [Tenacibaculum maritimum]CAA0228154.1 hypothetical protein TFA04_400002 [Tenacibaculum maritimum]
MNKIIFCLIILIFLFQSCYYKEGTDISKHKVVSLSYAELPNEVRDLLDEKIKEIVDSYNRLAYSLDKSVVFKYYRKKSDNWLEEVNNNDDYFLINDKIYRKNGNNGDPYIYYRDNIYYCEYNLSLQNYKDKKYYVVPIFTNE